MGLKNSSSIAKLRPADEVLHHAGAVFNPVRGNAMKLPFKDGTFGVVASSLRLHFMPDMKTAVKEASRVLKRNGSFVCCCPVMESGILVDSYWRYYYKKGRFYKPIFESDIVSACESSGLSYSRHKKAGKLLYFTCKKI